MTFIQPSGALAGHGLTYSTGRVIGTRYRYSPLTFRGEREAAGWTDEFSSPEPSKQQGPRQPEVLNVRKVVAYELLSLDGVAERPDGFFADWDDAMDANLRAVITPQDAVILGRRSYEEWAGFWPGSDIEPFATFINGVVKYVATLHAARSGMGQCEGGRRRTDPVRAGSAEPARS
jgi:hypothetical protein